MDAPLPDHDPMATVHVVGPPDLQPGGDATPLDPDRLPALASTVLEAALPASQRDDRFDRWEPPADHLAAVAMVAPPRPGGTGHRAGPRPVAYLGGGVDRRRLQLDAIVVPGSDDAGRGGEAELVVRLFHALEPTLRRLDADTVELWGRPERPWHGVAATELHLSELRSLHQLRCALPVDAEPVPTRGFVPGRDEEVLLRVNNRAFADHPDQGGMTVDDLEEAARQPWFRPEGIRLYEDPADPSQLAGFCWTKIHDPVAPGEPALGEIYAIGVDPDHHGSGLGKPVTAAGLEWLADQGLTVGMLYVEADNEPALRTYAGLGFEHHRTDRAWSRSLERRP